VIAPIIGMLIWGIAVGCTPAVASPLNPDVMVNARELAGEFTVYQKQHEIVLQKFALAEEELKYQAEQMAKFQALLITLASGNVADIPGLITLLLGSGLVGFVGDNIRKNGVIAGQKIALKKPV
jgi:hypothetical protein